MKRLVAFLPLAALAVLAAVFAFYSLGRDPQVKPDVLVGRPLPAVALAPLGGGAPVALPAATTAGGGPAYVNMFASWCAPCAYEHPQLTELEARGARIIGVAYKDEPVKTQGFLQRLGSPFAAVLTDLDGRASIELGVTGVPETYLVAADGKILAKHSGPLTPEIVADLERRRLAGR